ncbi:MAG: hypothetical protein ACQERB_16250 [Promethearchaeati archaeon]
MKTKWERPEIIVYGRGEPKLGVLGYCKNMTGGGGPGYTDDGNCWGDAVFPHVCRPCDTQIEI